MLELKLSGLFVEVVRRGSLSEAGRRLGMPPNTVSQRIDQLAASYPPRRHSDRAGRATRRWGLAAVSNAASAGHLVYFSAQN